MPPNSAAQLPGTTGDAAAPAGNEPPREPGIRYVRVLDGATGASVPGARVLSYEAEDLDALEWEDYAEGGDATDRWGRLALERGLDDGSTVRWIALADGHRCSTLITTPEGTGDFTLTLGAANSITGVVTHASSCLIYTSPSPRDS